MSGADVIDPDDWNGLCSDLEHAIDRIAGMFETKLQMRLESGEPKCANCAFWKRGEPVNDEHGLPTVGFCTMRNNGKEVGDIGRISIAYLVVTTDLQVCSAWKQA